MDACFRERKPLDNIIEISRKRFSEQSLDIFENKGSGTQNGYCLCGKGEHVPGIIVPFVFASHGKWLAWRTSCYYINLIQASEVEIPDIDFIDDRRFEVSSQGMAGMFVELDKTPMFRLYCRLADGQVHPLLAMEGMTGSAHRRQGRESAERSEGILDAEHADQNARKG